MRRRRRTFGAILAASAELGAKSVLPPPGMNRGAMVCPPVVGCCCCCCCWGMATLDLFLPGTLVTYLIPLQRACNTKQDWLKILPWRHPHAMQLLSCQTVAASCSLIRSTAWWESQQAPVLGGTWPMKGNARLMNCCAKSGRLVLPLALGC